MAPVPEELPPPAVTPFEGVVGRVEAQEGKGDNGRVKVNRV